MQKLKFISKRFPLLLILMLTITIGCDDREINLVGASSFLFTADIPQDTLLLGAIYVITLDIERKDTTQALPDFTLNHSVENGTGTLNQNGNPFQNGSTIDVGDMWTYQPTSLGPQDLQFTLIDQNGFQEKATIKVQVLDRFLFSASSADTLVLDEIHDLSLNIQLKEGPTPPALKLNYQIDNGNGALIRNGSIFESGGEVEVGDTWAYRPTSLGIQTLNFTLADENGFEQKASIEVEVLEFIPVPFSIGAAFANDETIIQIEAGLKIELKSDDPVMKYVLNYEVMQGAGELRTNSGTKIKTDQPLAQGATNWKYFPTGANENQLKLTVTDENGEEQTSNLSIFVDDKIPFTVSTTVQPATIRRNKSSTITVNISSSHPLFNTLRFTMEYSGNFDTQSDLLDAGGSVITPNTSIPINRGNTQFTYHPVVAGTHNVTFSILSEKGNSVNAVAVVNANELQRPLVQAESRFSLGTEICTASNDCQAPLFLDINLSGSVDGDANLGGKIVSYRLVIDRIEYTGDYNPNNPLVRIANGIARYEKGEDKIYSNVVHRPNTAIEIELRDDDGLWSDQVEISAPGSLPL